MVTHAEPGDARRWVGRLAPLPVVWSNALAGLTLGGGAWPARPTTLLLAGLSLLYLAGAALYVAFGEGGQRKAAPAPFSAGLSALFVGLLLLASLGWGALAAGAMLCGARMIWDLPDGGGPRGRMALGLSMAAVCLAAAQAAVSAPMPLPALRGGVTVLAYGAGLSVAMAAHERGAARRWALVLLVIPAVYGVTLPTTWMTAAALVAFLAWTGLGLAALALPAASRSVAPVGTFIAGLALVDALLMAGAGSSQGAAAALACFWLTVGLLAWRA